MVSREDVDEPSIEVLKKRWEGAVNLAKNYYEDDGELPGGFVLLYQGDDPSAQMLPFTFRDEQEKQQFYRFLKHVMLLTCTTHYIIVSESWTAPGPKDGSEIKVMPRDHPDRKEVLFYISVTPRSQRVVFYDIERSREQGKVMVSLTKNSLGDDHEMGGAMFEFLPEKFLPISCPPDMFQYAVKVAAERAGLDVEIHKR